MMKHLFAALIAAGLLVAPVSGFAQPKKEAETAEPAKKTKKAKRKDSPGMKAARERQKQCGQEWRAAKKAGKIEKGQKWPQYWSACNKRLKAKKT